MMQLDQINNNGQGEKCNNTVKLFVSPNRSSFQMGVNSNLEMMMQI